MGPRPPSEVDDQNAIIELITRYSLAISHCKDAELRQFYAPGAVFDGLARFSIDEEFESYTAYLQSLRAGPFPNLRQFLAPSTVLIDGDTAEAFTPVLLIATPHDQNAKIMHSGELHDYFINTSLGWRFSRRIATLDGA